MLNSADQTLYEKKKQANKQTDFSKHPTTSSTLSWSKSTSVFNTVKTFQCTRWGKNVNRFKFLHFHISIMGKVKVSYYVSKNSLSRRLSTLCLLACVASVSNRVTERELEREHLPLPRHSLFFCSRPNFLDELAMKRLLRRLFVCLFVFFCVCLVYIAYL